jgi:hypothetical protein
VARRILGPDGGRHTAAHRDDRDVAAWVVRAVAEHDQGSAERDVRATAQRLGLGEGQVKAARLLLAAGRARDGGR